MGARFYNWVFVRLQCQSGRCGCDSVILAPATVGGSTEKTDLKVTLKARKKAIRCTQYALEVCQQLREGLFCIAQRWRTHRAQPCAKMWLSLIQAPPEAIATGQGKRTSCRLFPSCFTASARYDGYNESQQRADTHHKSRQYVVEQDRECSAATWVQEAIGTIQPTAANDAPLAPFRITLDPTMSNERAGELAMRTSHQLGLEQAIIQRLLATHEANRRTPSHDHCSQTGALYPDGQPEQNNPQLHRHFASPGQPNYGWCRPAITQRQFGQRRSCVATRGWTLTSHERLQLEQPGLPLRRAGRDEGATEHRFGGDRAAGPAHDAQCP